MAKRKDLLLESNKEMTTRAVFLNSYNGGIPLTFPHASEKDLEHFQATHPLLFKKGNGWSIEKHRKRLMDWLPSHRNDL